VYDYWLGGKDTYQADRDAAAEAIKIFPKTVESARACRAFLSRGAAAGVGGRYFSAAVSR
jgi:hypothetical protein